MERETQNTEIKFDLAQVLNDEELGEFMESAGGKSLTEHFLDVTVRVRGGDLVGE